MNKSSVPASHNIDEFQYSGLTKAKSKLVKCPSVAESLVHLECRQTQSVTILSEENNNPNIVVFSEVIGVHIDDQVIVDGRIDFLKFGQLADWGTLTLWM